MIIVGFLGSDKIEIDINHPIKRHSQTFATIDFIQFTHHQKTINLVVLIDHDYNTINRPQITKNKQSCCFVA